MTLAPIALFVYNRPWHTRQTLEALANNELANESTLYIYSDGPKENALPEDIEKIKQVRELLHEKEWCKEVHIIESPINNGLANSIVSGVTEIVNKFGKIIVLEDDLITSRWFLKYMNEGLDIYENVCNVYSVNGYMFPIQTEAHESVLLPYTSTWGWGTWCEKWKAFEVNRDENHVIANCKFLRNRFNLADYNYTDMLLNAKNSWGIHWYFSVFKRNGLGVFPTKSLVHNIGFDGSGVNHTVETKVLQEQSSKQITINKEKEINLIFYKKYLEYFKHKEMSLFERLKRKLIK